MKKSVLSTLITMVFSAALGNSTLFALEPLCADIPFDFTLGPKAFQAGKYCIREPQDHVVRIYNVNNWSGMIAMVQTAEIKKQPGNASFTFNRYGNHYFLARVSDGMSGREFHKSAAEKGLIAKGSGPSRDTGTTLLAAK